MNLRRRRPKVPSPPQQPSRLPVGAVDLAALAVAILCAALAWASRGNLNVDGVSYLDLADRLRLGDWDGFVQGYWSPAYPALLAIVLTISGTSGSDAVGAAHVLNLLIAFAAIAILWRAARRRADPSWGCFALTALLVSSARTIRMDAVTPDLLLLALIAGFAVELLRVEGWRGLRLGVWAGAAFLAKTSVWPWLVVVAVVGGITGWRHSGRRRAVLQAVAVAGLPLVLWAGALSIEAGRPTLGSTGRLSACWYLLSCDGRTPDSHAGAHQNYHAWVLSGTARVKVAIMPEPTWTYAPWSDPTAWQQGIISQHRKAPTPVQLVVYVAKQAGLVLGIWLLLLVGTVLLPAWLTSRSAPPLREALRGPTGVAMLLGVLGVIQFVAVHAEPRLIAPFALLFGLGWITWRQSATAIAWQQRVAVLGLMVALVIGWWHLRDQLLVTASSTVRTIQLEATHPPHAAPHRVAVLGSALPMVPDLYRARAIVVAQVMDPDPAVLAGWPATAQEAFAARLRAAGATALWISRGRYAYRVIPLAPRAP